jgi:RNA polymerase sigma factor (sigma-70 family)
VDDRDQLLRLLRQLPPRQRTAIVLRYWEELSEAQVAQAMGCSAGTVKSVTSRGLRRLREVSGLADHDGTPQPTGRTS